MEPIKSQTPSTKLQTNPKFQYPMTETGLEFGILIIVICLIFEICNLEFIFLRYSNTPSSYELPLTKAASIIACASA